MSDANGTVPKPTILLVDDAPENLFLLSAVLKDNYRVKAATGGARALDILAKSPETALILLDVMMPEMDGFQVLEALKQNPATAAIPVIFLTALSDDADRERGIALGCVDYIHKPIDTGILLNRVQAHLLPAAG